MLVDTKPIRPVQVLNEPDFAKNCDCYLFIDLLGFKIHPVFLGGCTELLRNLPELYQATLGIRRLNLIILPVREFFVHLSLYFLDFEFLGFKDAGSVD